MPNQTYVQSRLFALALLVLIGCGGDGGSSEEPLLRGTLAYVVFECRVEPDVVFTRWELRVRKGEGEPVTAIELGTELDPDSPTNIPGLRVPVACQLLGTTRFGPAGSIGGSPFQYVAVSPNGEHIAFELTGQFLTSGGDPIPPEADGIYVVRADGSGLRRLGPASSVPSFSLDPLVTSPYAGFTFSPNNRLLVFVDQGIGPNGEEALQVWTQDVVTGKRTQVTRLPNGPRHTFQRDGPPTCCATFLDDETIEFASTVRQDELDQPPIEPPLCGNDVREGAEQCDGTDDSACAGSACLATCVCDSSSTPLPPLVFALRADQADGTRPYAIPGTGSPWTDVAGNGHDATLFNFAGDAISGWQGSGTPEDPYRLEYDGTTNQRVTIPAASIPELNPAGSHSIAVWFQTNSNVGSPPANDQFEGIYQWLESVPTPSPFTGLTYSDGKLWFWDCDSPMPVAGLEGDRWYHAVATKEDLGNGNVEVRAYLNGVQVYENLESTCLVDQGSELVIGAATPEGAGVYSREMSGAIAQVELWAGELTAPQVVAEFEEGLGLFSPGDVLPVVPPRRDRAPFTVKTNGDELRQIQRSIVASENAQVTETFIITGTQPAVGALVTGQQSLADITCPLTRAIVPPEFIDQPRSEIFFFDRENTLQLTKLRLNWTGISGGSTLSTDGSTAFFTSAAKSARQLGPPQGWTIVDESEGIRGPAEWLVDNGRLNQTSSVGNHVDGAPADMPGTFAVADGTEGLRDYTLSLTLGSTDDDAIGAMFRYQDPDNYYRVFLFNDDLPPIEPFIPRRLTKKVDGIVTVLAEDDFEFELGTDYVLSVTVTGDHIQVFQDDELVFDVTDSDLPTGGIALYSWRNNRAAFDDVAVTEAGGNVVFNDRFDEDDGVVETNPSGNCQLFSVDVTGANLRQLTFFDDVEQSSSGCAQVSTPDCGCQILGPYQDPWTEAVVFYSSCDPLGKNPYGGEIFAVQPDGTGLTQLTETQGFVDNRDRDGTFVVEIPIIYAYSSKHSGGYR